MLGWEAGGVHEPLGKYSRLCEAKAGNGIRLDKYLTQLGKRLAENILPED